MDESKFMSTEELEAPIVAKIIDRLGKELPEDYFKKYSVNRIVVGMSFWDRLWHTLRSKVWKGGISGLIAFLGAAANGSVDFSWAGLILAIVGGISTLIGIDQVKEGMNERKLKKVREKIDSVHMVKDEMVYIIAGTFLDGLMNLIELGGMDIKNSLRHIGTHMRLIGNIPKEIGELLTVAGGALQDDSGDGTGLSTEEIRAIYKASIDVIDAINKLKNARNASQDE